MEELICLSPVDGREVARRPVTAPAKVDQAVTRARRAQREWAGAPLAERRAILLRFVEAMEALNPEIVPELAWQMGRPVRYGGELRSLASGSGRWSTWPSRRWRPVELPGEDGTRRVVTRVPAGLVLAIAPWNYPYLTAANTIVAALLAGNAVLLKPRRRRCSPASGSPRRWRKPACPRGCSPTCSSTTTAPPLCSAPA